MTDTTAPPTSQDADKRKLSVLMIAITVVAVIAAMMVAPIAQDPDYHSFADARTIFGIASCYNVISNVLFIAAGLFGLITAARVHSSVDHGHYFVFCIGGIAIGLGSAYYHHAPGMWTLVWDRLPMTVAFMGLFSVILSDRISPRTGRIAFLPLLLVGVGSVFYWYYTETQGTGDLRAYGLVQFLPMVLIPVLLLSSRGRGVRTRYLWWTLALYGVAKVAEHFDAALMSMLVGISGHSVKHLVSGVAVAFAIVAMHRQHATTR